MDNQFKHDFINNTLRLEVLGRLISESLEKDEKINSEHLDDCLKFTQMQLDFLKELKAKS